MAEQSPPGGPGASFTVARFSLTIDGVEIAQFSDAAISSEVEPVEVGEQTGDTLFLKKLPGKQIPPTVTLTRSLNKDVSMSAWHQSVVEGQLAAARKNCTITTVDSSGDAVARYHLESAWPSKIEISGLKAGASEVLYETVTLTCDSPPSGTVRLAGTCSTDERTRRSPGRPTLRSCSPPPGG